MRLIQVCSAAAMVVALAAGPSAAGQRRGFDTANLDRTCKPCDDFYRFANGGWMAGNPIPAAYPAWGSFSALAERNLAVLHTILEEAAARPDAPAGSAERKLGDFYASGMDMAAIDAAGLAPLRPELDRIAAVHDARTLQDAIAYLHRIGVAAAFRFGADQDAKESTRVIAFADQGGLGLPDRDYYFKEDERAKSIRAEYLRHVTAIFALTGDSPEAAAKNAEAVVALESRLASKALPRAQRRDPEKLYNKMGAAELKALTPGFAWDAYFAAVGRPDPGAINVAVPDFFRGFDAQLRETPVDVWKAYLRWRLVDTLAGALPQPFVDEDFRFKGTVLTGTKEDLPLWKRRVRAADRFLRELLGQAYVKRTFTPEAKRRAKAMVENLRAALREDIGGLDWMSEPTRRAATAKLDAFMDKIGYPDAWKDYSALRVDRSSYARNVIAAARFSVETDLAKIGRPVDRTEWGISPSTVNAYYNPSMNEIVFPAGILQPPFFDPLADDALNYGGMGAVIGHEMTHGFDDQGAQFDARGNLKNWWTDEDLASFKARAKCVEDQFGGYSVDETTRLNGKLVVGESIADLGGLTIAYRALQRSMAAKPRPAAIDGFTPEQRFFLGWAQVWAMNQRPEYVKLLVDTDSHPLARFRVNGPLSNMPEFKAAWGCADGDHMVRPEAVRCRIW